jgi:hypothetical protein
MVGGFNWLDHNFLLGYYSIRLKTLTLDTKITRWKPAVLCRSR